tara:strand:- start:550 stop:1209 length:660 start_codon:yes stop_codon:yes gene_type:complete
MRNTFIALLMVFSTPAMADTTDEKLDLILEKITELSEKYDKLVQGTEAVQSLFSGSLFGADGGDEANLAVDDPVADALNSALTTDTKPQTEKIQTEPTGNDFLELVNWSATKGGENLSTLGTLIKINLTIRNKSNKKIALVDGSYEVTDKLGKYIMYFGIDSDLNIGPNETYSQSGRYDAGMPFRGDIRRLLTINPNLVEFNLDLDQILFEDSTKLTFD